MEKKGQSDDRGRDMNGDAQKGQSDDKERHAG